MRVAEVEKQWKVLTEMLAQDFGKMPDLQAVLFLIGVNELGGMRSEFSKEEKQDLMHIGICKVMTYSDYYSFEGYDPDGWPHYKALRSVGPMNLIEQESLLKAHVVYHFQQINFLETEISL